MHNREIDFAGVLLQRAQVMSQDDKDRTTDYSLKLLRMAKADGLVLTWSGSGNPGVDTMMLAAKAEKAGIKSTVVNSEMSKYAGDTGITYFPPEADAVVCAGNYEEETDLPRMETVLGGSMLGNPEIDARGPMSLPLPLPPRLHQRHRRQPPLQRLLLTVDGLAGLPTTPSEFRDGVPS